MTSSAAIQFHEANLESVILESELDFANELPKFDFQSRKFSFAMNRHNVIQELSQLTNLLETQHLKSVRFAPLLLMRPISIHLLLLLFFLFPKLFFFYNFFFNSRIFPLSFEKNFYFRLVLLFHFHVLLFFLRCEIVCLLFQFAFSSCTFPLYLEKAVRKAVRKSTQRRRTARPMKVDENRDERARPRKFVVLNLFSGLLLFS